MRYHMSLKTRQLSCAALIILLLITQIYLIYDPLQLKHLSVISSSIASDPEEVVGAGSMIKLTTEIEAICPAGGESIDVLILLASQPLRMSQRSAIRNTWALRRDRVSVAFFITDPPNSSAVARTLQFEGALNKDLVHGNNNNTTTTMSMLEWVYSHCSRASFLLKADDRTFINVPLLLKLVGNLDRNRKAVYSRAVSRPGIKYDPALPAHLKGPVHLFPIVVVRDLVRKLPRPTTHGDDGYAFIADAIADLGVRLERFVLDLSEFIATSHEEVRRIVCVWRASPTDLRLLWKIVFGG